MRITDKLTLHLIHSYLGYIAMNKLNEATTLADKDLNIYNLPEALEERPELMLSHVIIKTADEDSRIVRVVKLVYRLYSIKRSGQVILRWNAPSLYGRQVLAIEPRIFHICTSRNFLLLELQSGQVAIEGHTESSCWR